MLPFHCPIQPGEHLFSWINRIHLLMGYSSMKHTLSQLGIGNFTTKPYVYNQAFQDAINFYQREVLDYSNAFDNHTPLPIWHLSVTTEYYYEWRCKNIAQLSHGELLTRALSQTNWKFCPNCIHDDINEYGFSIWHVKHQLPGVTHCYKHAHPLVEDDHKLKDLRKAQIPQFLELSSFINEDSEELCCWSQFIIQVYEKIKLDTLGFPDIKEKLREFLKIPKDVKSRDNNLPIFDYWQEKLDNELPSSISHYLFPSASKKARKVNIFRLTMGYKNKSDRRKIVHPIYWLVIMYWLRNEVNTGV